MSGEAILVSQVAYGCTIAIITAVVVKLLWKAARKVTSGEWKEEIQESWR